MVEPTMREANVKGQIVELVTLRAAVRTHDQRDIEVGPFVSLSSSARAEEPSVLEFSPERGPRRRHELPDGGCLAGAE